MTSGINVLFAAHRLPYPPNKGEKIRVWRWITALARHASVHVVAPYDDAADAEHLQAACTQGVASLHTVYLPPVRTRLNASARSVYTGRPIGVEYVRHKGLIAAAARLRKELRPSLEIAYSAAASVLLPPVHADIPRVLDLVDVDSAKYEHYADDSESLFEKWLYRREARRLRRFETQVAAAATQVFLVSEPEAALFRARSGSCNLNNVLAMPHGVDLDTIAEPVRPPADMVPMSAVFVGDMGYRPNAEAVTWFCRDVLPRVCAALPQFRFYIVGRNPGASIRKLHDGINVSVVGAVADVRGYVQHAAVSLAPMHTARGVQNKILEAMAAGRPVITTPCGAEGLEAVAHALLIADTAEQMADALLSVLRDPESGRLRGLQARIAVRTHFDAERAGDHFAAQVLQSKPVYNPALRRF